MKAIGLCCVCKALIWDAYAIDNILAERIWSSVKYEHIYLNVY